MTHCSLGWYWRDDRGSELLSFVSGDVTIFSGVFSDLLCCLFSVCLGRLSSLGSPSLSPTSSLKYLICNNSPKLIMSDFVNTSPKYGARIVVPSYGLYRLGSESQQGQEVLSWPYLSRPWFRPTQPSVQWVLGVAANWGVYMPTHLHLVSRWKMSEAILLVPRLHDMDRNSFTIPTFLSWMYIYRQMFYSVDFV